MIGKNKNREEVKNLGNEMGNTVMMQQLPEDDEIDLMKLAEVLIEHLHYIILCFFAGALLFNAYAYFMVHPTYQSTAKLYMVSASNDSVVNFADLNIGQALTSDYEELIYSYPVLDEVIEKMDLDITSSGLAGMITIKNPEDTRVLAITTTCETPEMARDITNTLVEVIRDYLPKTMNTDKPNVVQYGRLESGKVGPGYLKNTLIGALLGAGLYCIIILFMYLTDDTIKGIDDLESDFGIVPLAVIPESEIFLEEENKHVKKRLFGRRTK